jgi:hypothetical protein
LVPAGSFCAGCDDSGATTTPKGDDLDISVDGTGDDKLDKLSASSSRRVFFVGLSSTSP